MEERVKLRPPYLNTTHTWTCGGACRSVIFVVEDLGFPNFDGVKAAVLKAWDAVKTDRPEESRCPHCGAKVTYQASEEKAA